MTKSKNYVDLIEDMYDECRAKSDTCGRLYPKWSELTWLQQDLFRRGWQLGSGNKTTSDD